MGIVRKDLERSTRGSIGLLDGRANRLVIERAWDGQRDPGICVQRPIPFPLATNQWYRLLLYKAGSGCHYLTLIDETTGAHVDLSAVKGSVPDPGNQLDAPGFLVLAGSACIREFRLWTPYPTRPRLLILGDSFTEGDALSPNYTARYANLVFQRLRGNCGLAGKSGDTTGMVLDRLAQDVNPFAPDYVLVLLGPNDYYFPTWLDNMQKIIAAVQERGATPLLGTCPPMGLGKQSYQTSVNSWIRSSGIKFVDFARALTVNGDDLTWRPEYVLADQIHPSVAGNAAMFGAITNEAPYLFVDDQWRPGVTLRRLHLTGGGRTQPALQWWSWPGRAERLLSSTDLFTWGVASEWVSMSVWGFLADTPQTETTATAGYFLLDSP